MDPAEQQLPTMEETETNQKKRRNSEEEVDGEKRLREGNNGPEVPATIGEPVNTTPDLDNDPQMQVSSLESDYNEPVAMDEAVSHHSIPTATDVDVPPQPPPPPDLMEEADVPVTESQPTEQTENDLPPLLSEPAAEPTLSPPPPPLSSNHPTDFDVSAKLREMGEISVQSVSKTEATKRTTDDEEPVDEVSLTKKSKDEETDEKKKVTNLRKNIRDVIDDTMLDASTLAAQREEQERLNRVQEQQRALRALQRQTDLDKRQSSILSLLQGTLDPTDETGTGSGVSISAVRVLDKKTGQVLEEIQDQQSLLEPGEIPNPALANAQLMEAQKLAEKGVVGEKKEVVTIDDSSDDDCIMLSDEEEEPDGDDDPHNSGLHVNDTYNLPDDKGQVLVNFGHSDTEPDVFVAPQIARALKPHQIGGIRFLYDNIIESLDRFDSSTGFGCILAHSMGLGKTLQLVCFCDIFLRHTSAKTVLCIMPINTLQNWLAEFNWWLPDTTTTKSPLAEFGEVRGRNFKIHVLNDSQKTIAARSKVVLNWSRTGGVLLIGYELYRLLCLKKVVKKKGKRAVRDPVYAEKEQAAHGELLEEIYEALVKPGPDLVVCDEGHRIKSSHASTSVALKQIRTKRRVVLTGYPLQNNLLEYWCMVDFVRPNYLGTKTEFCNMFEKPIQNGQCIDSTPQDIKLMRYRAHVLHSLLLGFVQRRSHLVLQSTLPNKLEYVMLVRMTEFQRKLYDVFMNEVVRKKAVPNPLKAFAVCCKIWNHPDVLYNFLKKREADLDLELEEELAMAEAKKARKEREKKAKEEEKQEKEKLEKELALRKSLENGQRSVKDEMVMPKVEQQQQENSGMSYQSTAMSSYVGGEQNLPVYGGYSNSSDPMGGVTASGGGGIPAYDPYGGSNYYSQYNNHPHHNSYHHQSSGGTGYENNHQYYSNNDQVDSSSGLMKAKTGTGYWDSGLGTTTNADQFSSSIGMQGSNGSGYFDHTNQSSSAAQYSQQSNFGGMGQENIPTTVSEAANAETAVSGGIKSESEESKKCKEDPEEDDEEDVGKGGKRSSPEKEIKSSRDDGIPYDWAVELMKDYIPDLLENAPKMEIFFCILNESLAVGDRILVFSQSLLTLNLIERYLQKEKVHGRDELWSKNTNYFRLDGSTTACDRERLINEFNTNDQVAIFLVSTRAGSLGINLVGANRVIVFDASWNPCHDTQAVCRVYRYGQKKQCYVYRMVMDNCLEKRIYDRQVNKQGMSDRVVDECNPDAHLSIKEVTNLCWDNDEETEVKDFSDVKDQYPDGVMQKVLENYSASLSKEPFRHESLLVDRKEKKLSMAEKRLAQRGYELEKQASTKSTYNYTGKVTQYRVFRTADGSMVHRAVGTVQPLDSTGSTPTTVTGGGASKWIPAEVWRQQGMTTQETTLPADVTIPSNSGDKSSGIVLKAGQKVMILKSTKGVYMQLETGKIIAIRTGPKTQPSGQATMNIPRPRGFGDANEVIKLDDDDEDEDGEGSSAENKAKVKGSESSRSASLEGKQSGVEGKLKTEVGPLTGDVKSGSVGSSSHQMATPSPSSSSGYGSSYPNANHSSYPGSGSSSSSGSNSGHYRGGGGSGSAGGHNYRPYGTTTNSSAKSHSSRDYNSYQTPYSTTENRQSTTDYQQKCYLPTDHSLNSGQSSVGSAAASLASSSSGSSSQGHSSGHSGQSYGSNTNSAYSGHYGATGTDSLPASNGQYGAPHVPHQQQQQQQQQQPQSQHLPSDGSQQSSSSHRQSVRVPSATPSATAAAAAAPSAYPPQPTYDYSNRYYDTQPKSYNAQQSAAAAASHYHHASSVAAAYQQSAYPSPYHHPTHASHHQYGQHRSATLGGEYNPNNPPYYMNPFTNPSATGVAPTSYQNSQSAYDQTAAHLQVQPPQQLGATQHHQPYGDVGTVYGGSSAYAAAQYGSGGGGGGAATTGVTGQLGGKVESTGAPMTEKRKESSSSSRSRRKSSDTSAFHKPASAESPEASKVADKKDSSSSSSSSSYYDRAAAANSSNFGSFATPYSPYNYPPSPYFYPSYCPPPPHTPPSAQGRETAKDSKNSAAAAASKYYDLSRSQHYQPPKW